MKRLSRKAILLVEFAAYFVWQLILANVRMAYDMIRPANQLRPGVIAVPLDVESDWEITVLSNLITLTPGTMTLDLSSDRKVLYVHAMDASDIQHARNEIKQGFERRVKELFS